MIIKKKKEIVTKQDYLSQNIYMIIFRRYNNRSHWYQCEAASSCLSSSAVLRGPSLYSDPLNTHPTAPSVRPAAGLLLLVHITPEIKRLSSHSNQITASSRPVITAAVQLSAWEQADWCDYRWPPCLTPRPGLNGSRLVGSRLATPKLAGTRLAGPGLDISKLAGPRLAGPRLAGSGLTGSGLVSPEMCVCVLHYCISSNVSCPQSDYFSCDSFPKK